MKRGMISLSQQQLTYVASLLNNSTNHPQELPLRITAALKTNQTTSLELSEESAEAVLDLLPMPSQAEEALITDTRNSFQTFLNQLRSSV